MYTDRTAQRLGVIDGRQVSFRSAHLSLLPVHCTVRVVAQSISLFRLNLYQLCIRLYIAYSPSEHMQSASRMMMMAIDSKVTTDTVNIIRLFSNK
jgi:hypothetical protein